MGRMNGFSLIELLVTVAIIVIGVTVAFPFYTSLVARYQTTTAVNGMVGILNFARMEAVRRQTAITICPSSSRTGCETRWSAPIIVFADSNKNKTRDNNEPLLRIFEPGPSALWRANRNYFQYQSNGMMNGTAGSLFYCHIALDARHARSLIINFGGRVRHSRDSDRDGIHEDRRGVALSCEGADA